MAWTTKDSLNPPKKADYIVNRTGIRLSSGACVLYRIVLQALNVDSVDGYSLLNIENSLADGGGTTWITVPFQRAGETVELRFRSGLDFDVGMGLDLTSGTAGDGKVLVTELYATKKC